jgi:hypothetical protein
MLPTFSTGDKLVFRKIPTAKIIRFGEPYLIEMDNGNWFINRIFPVIGDNGSHDPDLLILRSDNELYPDTIFRKSKMRSLYSVTSKGSC